MSVPAGSDVMLFVRDSSPLSFADRCDQCGAGAYVHVVLASSGGELFWCNHHWNDHKEVLTPLLRYINDDRKRLFAGIVDDRHVIEGQEVSLPPKKPQPGEKK